jgi:transcriptional regulator with XRE-family HTH domain
VVWTNLDRAVRFLRRRRGWRQQDLGNAAGVSRQVVSRLALRPRQTMTIGAICSVAEALDASVHFELRWRGEQLDRLIDAAHAAIQDHVAGLLATAGWLVRTEVSFNHFGDRGRCDVIAFHPATGILLVLEIKSLLGDLQETLGRLDVKRRLAAVVAAELGWGPAATVVVGLVLAESTTNRRRVESHAALFSHLALRGRAAHAWLRQPERAIAPGGLLWFEKLPAAHGTGVSRNARVRKSSPAHPA